MSSARDPVRLPVRLDGQIFENKIRRALSRRWGGKLSPSERVLLDRLVDVTYGWERPEFTYSLAKLIEGTNLGYEPVGIGLTAAKEALSRLCALGLVEATGTPTGTRFVVFAERILNETGTNIVPIPTSKREKSDEGLVAKRPTLRRQTTNPSSPNDQPFVAKRPTLRIHTKNPLSEHILQGDDTFGVGGASADASPGRGFEFSEEVSPKQKIADIVKTVSDKSSDRKKTATEAALEQINHPSGKISTQRINDAWNALLGDSAPKAAWSKKEAGQMNHFRDAWIGEGFGDFLAWMLPEWSNIRVRVFRWMKNDIPAFPEIGFCLTFRRFLFDGYADRKKTERENDLRLSQYERLLAKGVPVDEIVKNAERSAVRETEQRLGRTNAPRPQPFVRPRTRFVQPVATDDALPEDKKSPTHVTPVGEYDEDGFLIAKPRSRKDYGAFE